MLWTRRGVIRTIGGMVVGLAASQLLTACGGGQESAPSGGSTAGSGQPGMSTGNSPGTELDALKGSGQVTVADPGGPFTKAWAEAYHLPFQRATGIQSIQVARQHEPVAAVRSQVESKSYTWDAVGGLTTQAHKQLSAAGLLEPLDWDRLPFAKSELMKEAVQPDWMGVDVFAVTLAYRTDKYSGDKAPKTWADFFDVKRFPGRRALQKSALNTLEIALLADGVDPDKLYPLDVDRAFKKLDEIKPHITLWWESGAQTTQALQTGEIELAAVYNARAQTAADAGAPVAISWNQGLYALEGLAILKGSPNKENAQKFIAFASRAENMAMWARYLAYGPTNLRAYKFISEERAKLLPTYEDNLRQMTPTNYEYWSQHFTELTERFNSWLIS